MAGNYVEAPYRTFQAGAAIAQHLRVKLTAGKLAAAGVNDVEVGTLRDASFADLDYRAVRLRNAPGTSQFVASVAITSGADVYAAAGGKVAATGTVLIGTALEAATADGDIIEVLRRSEARTGLDVQVLAAAGSVQGDAGAVTTSDSMVFVHATGADATKGIQLPAARAGAMVIVKNADAANAVLKIWPATGDAINAIAVNTSMSIAAKTSVALVAVDSTTWYTLPLLPS